MNRIDPLSVVPPVAAMRRVSGDRDSAATPRLTRWLRQVRGLKPAAIVDCRYAAGLGCCPGDEGDQPGSDGVLPN